MRILFISTHNFATNPRLVKEVELALCNGYDVSILCCEFNNWSKTINKNIFDRLKNDAKCYILQGNRKPFISWFISSFLFSFSGFVLRFFPQNILLLSLRSNKRSWLLLQYIKKINEKTDLVVAHNPGSFYPAMMFAKKNKIPFGVDLEDYHPGETTDKKKTSQLINLSKKILPQAVYLSAASTSILGHTLNDVGKYGGKSVVVMNWFSSNEFLMPRKSDNKRLQMVWFSQNIAFGRGLEQIIPVIKEFEFLIEVHLYGNIKEKFFHTWVKGVDNIILHGILPQKTLHKELSDYDVGLAIEPGKDINNGLAVSNKILAYFQAGLFVVASNTIAQKEFLDQHPSIGILTELDRNSFIKVIGLLSKEKEKLRSQKQERFIEAKDFCWENESKKILQNWTPFI